MDELFSCYYWKLCSAIFCVNTSQRHPATKNQPLITGGLVETYELFIEESYLQFYSTPFSQGQVETP